MAVAAVGVAVAAGAGASVGVAVGWGAGVAVAGGAASAVGVAVAGGSVGAAVATGRGVLVGACVAVAGASVATVGSGAVVGVLVACGCAACWTSVAPLSSPQAASPTASAVPIARPRNERRVTDRRRLSAGPSVCVRYELISVHLLLIRKSGRQRFY